MKIIIIKKWSSVFWNYTNFLPGKKRGESEERNPRNYPQTMAPNDWKHVKTVKCENSWQQSDVSSQWSLTPGQVSPVWFLASYWSQYWPLIGRCPRVMYVTCLRHGATDIWHGNIAWEKHLVAFCRRIVSALSSCHLRAWCHYTTVVVRKFRRPFLKLSSISINQPSNSAIQDNFRNYKPSLVHLKH